MHRLPPHQNESGGTTPDHTVFLSYSRADRKAALAVVRVLEDAGYRVWWDGLLEGGERFSETTEAALQQARAVVVLWSKTSAASHWVHDEATRGRESGRLVPLSIDGCLPPLGFGQFQSIDVSHVLSKPGSEPMRKVVRAVAALHDGPAPSPVVSRDVAPSRTRRQLLTVGGLAIIAAGGGVLLWRAREPDVAVQNSNGLRRIAVLPFANLSVDAEQRYFSDGLTSEIRVQLSRNAKLQISGQTSSEQAGKGQKDERVIARALGVDFLLGGNVQKAGDRVKINVELIDGATGVNRWANSWQRPLTDIFAVQSEIAAAVASALSVAMGTSAATLVGGTTNVEAFDAYLQGRALYEAGIDEDSDRRALAYFERAIALDKGYAGAHAARGRRTPRRRSAA